GAWSSEHGTWYFQAELPHRLDGTRRTRRRGGYATQTLAQDELDKMAALVEAAEPHGGAALAAIGDLIENRLQTGEPLPAPEEIAQQLNPGTPALGEQIPTVAEWLATWLARRRKLRGATKLSYSGHIR